MTREQVHDIMENELRCVQRGNYCDRDCAKCPLVKDDKELIEAYGYVIKALEQMPKILETLDFAIDASNGETNYFVGFRNGLRYSKSLIDGEEPQFENCTEQESKTEQFAKWVAEEIFDDNWEYNKDAFGELACRKLAKLGIVKAKGDEWELVETQESEDVK